MWTWPMHGGSLTRSQATAKAFGRPWRYTFRPDANWWPDMPLTTCGRRQNVGIEAIARAVLSGDALAARSLVQDWLATAPSISAELPPTSPDLRVRALSAALSELFADRLSQQPPDWARGIGALDEPLYLLKAA